MSILVISDRDAAKFRIALARLEAKINTLTTQGADQHMALADDLNAFAGRVDTALSGIAGDIRDLKNGLPSGPITAAEGDALKVKLEALANRAEGIDAETPGTPAV